MLRPPRGATYHFIGRVNVNSISETLDPEMRKFRETAVLSAHVRISLNLLHISIAS